MIFMYLHRIYSTLGAYCFYVILMGTFCSNWQALEQHQELLQLKIKEQDARSRQLERELEEMARKHADAEAEWTRKISSVKAETAEAISRRYEKDKNDRKDEERMVRRRIDPEKLGKRKKRALSADYSAEHSDVDKSQYEPSRRKPIELHYDETAGRNRRTTRHSSSPDVNMEESLRDKAISPGLHFHEGKSRNSRTRRREPIDEGEAEESLRDAKEEGSKRGRVRSRKADHVDKEENFTAQSHAERSRRSKSEKKTRNTRDKSIETETVITKTGDEGTQAVQVVRDDEIYRLSRGRIELLESEKAAYMELNSSLQEENKALKQLALSLQKGAGQIYYE